MNYSIQKLIDIKNNINIFDNYPLNYNYLDYNNLIYDYFIINNIYYKINNYIKPIFIYVPIFFTLTFILGLKELLNL